MAVMPLFLILSIRDIMHLSERSKRAVDIRGRFEHAFTEGCLMEAHIINIMRFGICILTLAVSVRVMIRTASPKIRRLTAVLAAVLIFFNEKAGEAAYLIFGSLLEMTAAVVALGFVLVAGIMIVLLPAVGLIRWLTH
jgi:hypothetical protein